METTGVRRYESAGIKIYLKIWTVEKVKVCFFELFSFN